MQQETFIKSAKAEVVQDPSFEIPLRPASLEEFSGQTQLCEKLRILCTAARERSEALGHILFSGPPGLGKTTLAHIVSKVMGTKLVVTSGPVLEKAGDLAGLLTSLKRGDIFFIDEMHRLSKGIEEYLYPAMEDFALDLLIDSGPSSRSVQVKLHPFTLVGATTKVGLISAPMRSRFAFVGRLDHYEADVLHRIVLRSAALLRVEVEEEAALEIARRSRGTPRIANNHLRWVRDFASVHKKKSICKAVVLEALKMMHIDERGLDEVDIKLLKILIDHYGGGPVGISTLAVSIGEEAHTVEEVVEPYLIMQGFLKRTSRGREATALAHDYMKRFHQGVKNV